MKNIKIISLALHDKDLNEEDIKCERQTRKLEIRKGKLTVSFDKTENMNRLNK